MNNNIIKFLWAIAIVASIVSCKISKDIETPMEVFPDQFRFTKITNDTTSIADLNWNIFFEQEDIIKLIDSALLRNNEIQIAQKNIEIAQLKFNQSKWNNIPQLNLGLDASSSNPSNNSFMGMNLNQALSQKHIDDYSLSVSASWEVDIWNKISNQKKESFAFYLQSEEVKKALQTNVIANVSKGYYNLLMLQAQIDIAKRSKRLYDSTARIVKLKYQSGQVTSLAVQQVEAQQLSYEQLIPLLEKNFAIQENSLSVITGTFPKEHLLNLKLTDIILKQVGEIGIPVSLLKRRPDVKAAELSLQIANAQVGISKANLYPNLRITAQAGVNAFEASNWFNIPASLFGTVAAGITQPILNNKRLKTQYQIALVEREKAVLNFRQVVLEAVREVSDALIQVEKLDQQEIVINNKVVKLQEAIHNATLLFQNGMAEYLEVLSAQSNLLQSELELADLRREQLVANIDVYRSLGGGWK